MAENLIEEFERELQKKCFLVLCGTDRGLITVHDPGAPGAPGAPRAPGAPEEPQRVSCRWIANLVVTWGPLVEDD